MMGAGRVHEVGDEEWTPERVGDELVEAIQWARSTGGPVGPRGFTSSMPEIVMDHFDRLQEQWPLLDDIEAGPPKRRRLPPERVSQLERVLLWQSTYLKNEVVVHALSVWLFCKVRRGWRYSELIAGLGQSRATAYRRRDKALSLIAVGLTRNGILRGSH